MRPSLKRSIVAASLALALPFGLAACSGGTPPKDEVQAGLKKLMGPELEGLASDEDLDSYYACMTDAIYDDVEDVTLRNIADGKDEVAESDRTELTGAATECIDHIM